MVGPCRAQVPGTLGLSHPQPRTAGSSLTSPHFLPSLSLSENGDGHLLLGKAKGPVCVVLDRGVLRPAAEGPAPSCVWAHVRVHFRNPGV